MFSDSLTPKVTRIFSYVFLLLVSLRSGRDNAALFKGGGRGRREGGGRGKKGRGEKGRGRKEGGRREGGEGRKSDGGRDGGRVKGKGRKENEGE